MKNKSILIFLSVLMIFTVVINTEIKADNERVIIDLSKSTGSQLTDFQYINYYIQPGDTLYKIGMKYSVTIDSIMRLNNINSHLIYPGQRLIIPIPVNHNRIIYTVKAGDSLYLISLKYKVSIASIKSANNLTSDLIYIGQRLEIPVPGDSSNDSNSGKDSNKESYNTLNGKVNLNNKTGSSGISAQDTELENKVFPLLEYDNGKKYEEKEIIVKYKPVVNNQSVEEFEKEENLLTISSVSHPEGNIVKYQIPADEDLLDLLKKYNQKDNVLWAEPNYIYYPTAIPDDQYYNNYQWNMVNINMEAAWDINRGDNSVIVAVLDTGIIPTHPDLRGNLIQGVDFVGGIKGYSVDSYNITDNDPTDETPYEKGGSHGTHVAGIIGAVSNNKLGISGVSWNVKILPIRALTRSGGTSWDIAEGIYYAIDQGADIINMSFGSNYDSYYQREAIKDAVANGITIVAATGNEGSSVYYPAAYPETIAVGAVGRNNTKTAYSNFGPEVDIVAPGGDYGESILSTWGYYNNGSTIAGYTGMIGTSMATPHVSGVAALLVANGITDPEEIRSRLLDNTRDLGETGKDNLYGYGLVDVYGALLNKKIEKPFVFAADKKDSSIIVKSEIVKASSNNSFTLNQVSSNAEYIIAWFDSNNNNIIDGGDYFGEVRYRINDDNITVNMSYLANNSYSPYYQVIK